ncbi:hypothetical protein EAG14_21520 [Acidovorax sp. 1608163]|nr:hypothetical protein EAG14_21520 [Acidovorax sp. 1608163]
MRVSHSVLQLLRRAGQRPTVARIAILQVVQAAPAPSIGADDAYLRLLERGTRVSLSTVYRTFAQLQSAGLLQVVPTPTQHGASAPGRVRALYRLAEALDGRRRPGSPATECQPQV